MKVQRLRLKNYRGFEDLEIPFNEQFNVLIGDNGKGKTSILDALSLSLSSYFLGLDNYYAKSITEKDIRIDGFSDNLELQFPIEIEVTGSLDGHLLTWTRDKISLKGATRQSDNTYLLKSRAKEHQEKVRSNEFVNLPVFSYYGTGRLWKEKNDKYKIKPKSSRFDGYTFALDSESSSKHFIEKMKT